MKINDLLTPGLLSNGIKLRVEAAKAISAVQINAMRTPGGLAGSAGILAAFFADCAVRLAPLYEVIVPTIVSRVATSAVLTTMTFSEAMDTDVLPAPAAFTSAGNTVVSLEWLSTTVLCIKGTGYAAADNMTYTQPAYNALRDLSGNKVATSSAALT